MNADIVMKCRSDLFVHNSNIFEIFLKENMYSKIMYAEFDLKKEKREYWISDFCQVSKKEVLLDFWNNIDLDDGKYLVDTEMWIIRNYILKNKKDKRSWNSIKDKYFFSKGYHDDFQIEFEKTVKFEYYQNDLLEHSTE